jgi:hypothetical protein
MRKEQRTDETNDWDPFKPKRLLRKTALRLARTSNEAFAFDVRKWSTAEAKELMEQMKKNRRGNYFFKCAARDAASHAKINLLSHRAEN